MVTLKSISYSLCQLVQYAMKYKDRLSQNSKTRFISCGLLSSIKECVIIGRNTISKKLSPISMNDLSLKISKCNEIKSNFPSHYMKKNLPEVDMQKHCIK